jgi:hypothetical protein
VLLEPWLAGSAHASAIQATCKKPSLLAAVRAAVPTMIEPLAFAEDLRAWLALR